MAPRLNDYMGWSVFEQICGQWLERHAESQLGLQLGRSARYWSRNGQIEIDRIAAMQDGGHLFVECKWRPHGQLKLSDLVHLRAKVANLSEPHWRERPAFALFTSGGVEPELRKLAEDPEERLWIVAGDELFPPRTELL